MPGESMVYVYSGEVEIAIDGSSFPALKKGELIMVPADTLYSIDAVVECKLMILILKE
jgi:quercetin dioxygenase-like cupin family protein